MSLQLTPTGLQIETFDEIFNELVAQYKNIYGSDIVLTQDTADGQRVGIEAKMKQDIETALLEMYNGFDVDLSEGEALNRAIKYCGITRRPATKSTWDITVSSSLGATLYSGYTIKDDAGQEWVKDTAVTIPSGDTVVTFEAANFGAVQGLVSATFEQVTVIPEVTGFSVSAPANVGIDEETDEALRIRRNKSIQNPSYSLLGSLFAKIANLDNVTDVYVHENKTDVYDATLDLNAHSIWVIVEGGELADIAEVMAIQKTGGTGEKGSVTVTYLETLPSGFVITHEFLIDRPTYTDLYIRVDATRTGDAAVDTTLIENNLASRTFNIFQAVEAYTLYEDASSSGTGFFLSNLEISDDGITWTDGKLDAIASGKYQIDVANITVTEIIP